MAQWRIDQCGLEILAATEDFETEEQMLYTSNQDSFCLRSRRRESLKSSVRWRIGGQCPGERSCRILAERERNRL